jgi:pimeloyl-ACP methyl ester carboxylesterase
MFNPRSIRILIVSVVVAAGVGALFMKSFGLGVIKHYGDPYVARQPFDRQPSTEAQADEIQRNPEWISDRFEVAPGITLDGIVHKPRNASRPWVLYFHGNTSNGLGDAVGTFELLERGADWGFAAWTYRGYGRSLGVSCKDTIRADSVLMAERLFTHWQVTPAQLRLFGISLGTAPATHAGMVLSQRNQTPAGAVFIATGFRQTSPIRSLLYDVSSETWRRDAIRCPILIAHGLLDPYHSPKAALEDFAALTKTDSEFLLFRAGHNPLGLPQAARRVREFIEQPDAR